MTGNGFNNFDTSRWSAPTPLHEMTPEARASIRRNTPKRACCGRPVGKPHSLACLAVGGPGVGKMHMNGRRKKPKPEAAT